MCEVGIQGEVCLKTENQSKENCALNKHATSTQWGPEQTPGEGLEQERTPGEGLSAPAPHLTLSTPYSLTSYTSFHFGLRFSLMTLLWKIWLPTRITP